MAAYKTLAVLCFLYQLNVCFSLDEQTTAELEKLKKNIQNKDVDAGLQSVVDGVNKALKEKGARNFFYQLMTDSEQITKHPQVLKLVESAVTVFSKSLSNPKINQLLMEKNRLFRVVSQDVHIRQGIERAVDVMDQIHKTPDASIEAERFFNKVGQILRDKENRNQISRIHKFFYKVTVNEMDLRNLRYALDALNEILVNPSYQTGLVSGVSKVKSFSKLTQSKSAKKNQ